MVRIHFPKKINGLGSFILLLGLGFSCFNGLAFAANTVNTVPTSATPAIQQNLINPTNQSQTTASPCTYVASDTYVGTTAQSGYGAGPYSTENIGSGSNGMGGGYISMPSPPLTDANNNLILGFRGGAWTNTGSWAASSWNSTVPSTLSKQVSCSGVYQVYFTIQLQATYYNSGNGTIPAAAAPSINVSVCDQTTDGNTPVWGSTTFSNNTCPPSPGNTFVFNPVCNNGNYCTVMTFPFATQVYLQAGQTVAAPAIHTSAPVNVTGGEFSVVYISP